MRDIEHRLQCGCVRWLRLQHPDLLCFAIPNGGARNAVTGARLKAEGVLAGVPDLMIAEPRGYWAGLFIEMKTATGKLSKEQKQMQETLTEKGYSFAVCRSFDEFRQIVTDYMRKADTGQI